MESVETQVSNIFDYKKPSEDSLPKFANITEAVKNLATVILSNCPDTPYRRRAIEELTAVRMFANASIAIDQK